MFVKTWNDCDTFTVKFMWKLFRRRWIQIDSERKSKNWLLPDKVKRFLFWRQRKREHSGSFQPQKYRFLFRPSKNRSVFIKDGLKSASKASTHRKNSVNTQRWNRSTFLDSERNKWAFCTNTNTFCLDRNYSQRIKTERAWQSAHRGTGNSHLQTGDTTITWTR